MSHNHDEAKQKNAYRCLIPCMVVGLVLLSASPVPAQTAPEVKACTPFKIISNIYPDYPNIAEDYQKTFRVLKTLPCDVFLGPHGNFFDLNGKFARMPAGPKENPFIDPAGCRQFVERGEAAFLKQLEEERQTRK